MQPTGLQFYCALCRKYFIASPGPGELGKTFVLTCTLCHRQHFAQYQHDRVRIIDPGPCEYECEYTETYGFVPEVGCTIHD